MDGVGENMRAIEGRRLTAWSVLPGGTRIRLDFLDRYGTSHQIVLPFDALTGLLMTLPRMLQAALDTRVTDGSLRFVQPLGRWRLERAENEAALILQLGTRDGVDVAFALDGGDADSLGAALLAVPGGAHQPAIRRAH